MHFNNFGDKLLHHLKTASHVLILLGCRLFSFHHHRRLQPADVTALCPWDGSISLAQASAPHTKHDKLVGGLLSFITWAVISVSADKIAVTKHARLLTALAAQINSRPLPTQVRWSWSNAVERLLHFWPVAAVFELLLLFSDAGWLPYLVLWSSGMCSDRTKLEADANMKGLFAHICNNTEWALF